MAQHYGSVDYWDDRYGNDKEPFEWFQNYSGIRHFLSPKYLNISNERVELSDDIDVSGENPSDAFEATTSECQPDGKHGDHDSSSGSSETATERPHKPSEIQSNDANNPFHSTKECRVLIAGCGNSQVGEAMLSDGFRKITNVDFSSIVINQLNEKYTDEWHEKLYARLCRERKSGHDENTKSPVKTKSQIRSNPRLPATFRSLPKKKAGNPTLDKMMFYCQDLTKKLNFQDESFDLIFCKGTFDAVLCSASTADRVEFMMNECHRVLDSHHGVMVIVSYGNPEERLSCFDNIRWEAKTYTVSKPIVPGEKIGEEHYVYILFKKQS